MIARVRVLALTLSALVGFAANSLLARGALRGGLADAASYTAVRIGAGALTLALISWASGARPRGSWASAAALFGYAIAFSLAYLKLSASTGALLLFGAVQATMVGWGIVRGHRPSAAEWIGL